MMDTTTTSTALKRSHSPDADALTQHDTASPQEHVKRARFAQRPPGADAYLEGLGTADLVHIICKLERFLHDTPYLADAYALIYPSDLDEQLAARQQEPQYPQEPCAQEEEQAPASLANMSAASHPLLRTSSEPVITATAPIAAHTPHTPHTPHVSSPLTHSTVVTTSSPHSAPIAKASESAFPSIDAPPSAPSRLYTPSIPAASAAPAASPELSAPGVASSGESFSLPTSEHESASTNGNISSRIAAILESIQNTNASGPMLGLQGQPLAPSKQGTGASVTSGLSSLLSNSFPHSNARAPANSALSRLLEQSSTQNNPAGQPSSATSVLNSLASRTGFTTTPTLDYKSLTTTPGVTPTAGTSSLGFTTTYGLNDTHADDASATHEPPRITSTLPSYEDMIIEGLQAIGDVNGTPPRMLFHWMEDTYPLMKNFRPSASQALQKAFKRGRLHKAGSLYRINPHWDGSNAGRKPTRRPQIGKDHPMMVNGPKGPAPASPFKARAQFEGAAAYRQSSVHLNRQRSLRHPTSLRPGPKPYGQPGAAPLDNPASSIFQNGAAAAALLLAHQQRARDGQGSSGAPGVSATPDLTPTLSSLVRQLRASSQGNETPGSSSLSSVLASALLKHAQRPADGTVGVSDPSSLTPLTNSLTSTSSPVLQLLSRLLTSARTAPPQDARTDKQAYDPSASPSQPTPASGPGSLSASIETLVRQASRAAQQQPDDTSTPSLVSTEASAAPPTAPTTSQSDLDAAVSQTLQAAFQELGPADKAMAQPDMSRAEQQPATEGLETVEFDGVNLDDYRDALRTLTAALGGAGDEGDGDPEEQDEEAQRLADEQAIADAEADLSGAASDSDDDVEHGGDTTGSSSKMESLLRSYGIDVSTEAVHHLTETLRDPNMSVSDLTENKDKVHEVQEAGGEGPEAQGVSQGVAQHEASDETHGVPAETEAEAQAPGESGNGEDPTDAGHGDGEATSDGASAFALLDSDASDAAKNQSIQSQLEALIASLAADTESG